MALPTGSGSEILGRVSGGYSTASTTTIITVPALHIYTILNGHFCRNGANTTTLTLKLHDGTADREIISGVSLSGNTFVWDSKIVLMPGDLLKLTNSTTDQIVYWVSYIDQDWS